MNPKDHKKLHRNLLCIIVLCLCACLALGVGISFARYRTDIMAISYWFKSSFHDTIVMHGVVAEADVEQIQAGMWPDVPEDWTYVEGDMAELQFSVSNGNSASEHASRDQAVSIQLVASLSVADPEALRISLSIIDEEGNEVIYTGIPAEIMEGSFLYSVYGDGWVYSFVDENDAEKTFFLAGDALSYQNFLLCVEGNVAPSLLSIEMNGAYVNTD